MSDAAANDALDALEACPCCLLGPQQRCLKTPYTHLDNTEVYSDMLRECFNIQLDVASEVCGICEECVVRLRDASHFKRQVQRSQVQLRQRLARALKIIEKAPPVTVKSEKADEDGTSDNLSVEPPVETADTGPSEDSADCEKHTASCLLDGMCNSTAGARLSARAALLQILGDESDVSWEAANDDGTSDASSASLNQSEKSALDNTCSVRLEQVFVDTEQRTCRVGSRTYKLSSYSRSPRPIAQGKGNDSRNSTKSNLKNAEMASAGAQKASVSRQVYSVTNEDVGDIPGVKHSKTANITKEITPYKCSRCSYACDRKGNLLRHERKHTDEKPYKCSHCSYACTTKDYLLVHERKHTGEKPYKCKRCSYASAQKSPLVVHERNHTGEKPYKCSQCSYASAQKWALLVHERNHTGDKPYKCKRCSYASFQKSHLVVHEKKHTGEKPYKCSHCSYASAHKCNLLLHIRVHTGDKPYKCSHCSYASATKSNLLVHERKHDFE